MSAKELLEMTASISSAVLDTQGIRDKIWGVITDPNFASGKHRWLGVAILLITLAVLALIFVFAGRVH